MYVIRDPELIDPGQRHAASEVQKYLEIMRRIGGDPEGPRLHGQQIVFTHHPGDPLVIHEHAATV
jgi:hypothetical protein